MIICSCRVISTEEIKNCINTNSSVQSVLRELGWKGDCGTCCNNLVKHINSIMEEKRELLNS